MKEWLIIMLLLVTAAGLMFLGGMAVKTQLVLNDCMAQCDALIQNISDMHKLGILPLPLEGVNATYETNQDTT